MSVEKTLLRDATILFSAENIPSLPIWKNQLLSKKTSFSTKKTPISYVFKEGTVWYPFYNKLTGKWLLEKFKFEIAQFCNFVNLPKQYNCLKYVRKTHAAGG